MVILQRRIGRPEGKSNTGGSLRLNLCDETNMKTERLTDTRLESSAPPLPRCTCITFSRSFFKCKATQGWINGPKKKEHTVCGISSIHHTGLVRTLLEVLSIQTHSGLSAGTTVLSNRRSTQNTKRSLSAVNMQRIYSKKQIVQNTWSNQDRAE